MVEMNEVANIVNNATKNSLIILDEVGRGTSTYDGLSIAWSLTEYINNKIKAKTLFATHYHELTKLEDIFTGIRNYNVAVQEEGDHIVFEEIIYRAKEILASLEPAEGEKPAAHHVEEEKQSEYYSDNQIHPVIENLLNIDLLNITPLNALNLLYRLQTEAKKYFDK